MRISCSLGLLGLYGPDPFFGGAAGPATFLAIGAALLLLIGVVTRSLAVAVGLAMLFKLADHGDPNLPFHVLSGALGSLALALSGPGAFSFDAQRFGRSVVTVRSEP